MGKGNRAPIIDQRVAQVVVIIGAESGREKVRIDVIEEAIRLLDAKQPTDPAWSWPPWRPLNKHEKRIAQSFGLALGNLEKKLRRKDGKAVLLRATYPGEEFSEWQAQLKRWRECFEAFGGKALKDSGGFFPSATTWPLGRPKPSAPKFAHKHNAVAAAAAILESHGLRLTATRKTSTRNASLFCRVSAVLARDSRIYHQCRVFIKSAKPGAEIIPPTRSNTAMIPEEAR
jgi:hypothetical protein